MKVEEKIEFKKRYGKDDRVYKDEMIIKMIE